MLLRSRPTIELLSISALDLFASALGSFMLLSIAMFPYYLKEPAREAEQTAARAALARATDALATAEGAAAAAAAKQTRAAAALEDAQARLARAEAAAAEAQAIPIPEPPVAAAPPVVEAAKPVPAAPPPPARKKTFLIGNLDLVFVMDTTGSMRDELADVQANLEGLVRVLSRLTPSLRVGFVAYKDRGEEYLTRVFPLGSAQASGAEMLRFVQSLGAGGGGDDPEPVDEALAQAVAFPWRTDAKGRIVVIGDAAAHAANIGRALDLAQGFRRSSPQDRTGRSVSAIFTGEEGHDRRFFERLAEAGGGAFSVHRGQIFESVLLSVLEGGPVAGGAP